MLTTEDREEIRQLVGAMIAESAPPISGEQSDFAMFNVAAQVRDLVDNGFTELAFVNPKTGERVVVKASPGSDAIVDVVARAMEVFGTREKALRWLRTPVRSLGDQTPISLVTDPEGLARVQDTLGRVEHGVW